MEALGQTQDFRSGSVEVDINYYDETLRTRHSPYQSSSAARLYVDPRAGGRYALYNILASGQIHAPNLSGGDIGWSDSAADGTRVLWFRQPDYADPLRPDLRLSYVSYGGWEFISRDTSFGTPQRRVNAYFYFGVPTTAGDLPIGGSGTYEGFAEGILYDRVGEYSLSGKASLTANFSDQSFSTFLQLSGLSSVSGASVSLPSLNGTGHIGAGNTFQGTWDGGTYQGSILGGFFGPDGGEFGYTFAINNADLNSLGGGVVTGALKQYVAPPPPPPPPPPGSTFPLQGATTFDLISSPLSYARETNYSPPVYDDNAPAATSITVTPDYQTGTYTITTDSISASFTGEDLAQAPDPTKTSISFRKVSEAERGKSIALFNNLTPQLGTNKAELQFHYLSYGEWTQVGVGYNAFLYGSPSSSDEMPRTGTASYALHVRGQGFVGRSTAILGDGRLDADFDSGRIYTELKLIDYWTLGADTPFGDFTGTATISSDGPTFQGSLSSYNTNFSGDFHGSFYGPDAAEVGYAFSLTSPATPSLPEGRIAGVAVGNR
ncbi:hypothetical protein M2333_002010 [Sphingobium sp. B11D3B]|uniref:transferrin-binding protein-like solute binding protein n=1 Tax=Sphingobium sp. B11D3B TaxID=2940575 RepID=UPI0022260401|nr:transferrin-binding protein-like solute binding protein [Sphingobium sp. B11D3B]MCW2388964.1 hypothetical protein [Sphingobium sp. B11D3B]